MSQSQANGVAESQNTVEAPIILVAKSTNVHAIRNIISSLSHKKDQNVIVTMQRTGIKFTVEDSTVLQGNAFLPESIFQEYHWNANYVKEQFAIRLSLLIESLSLCGDKNIDGTGPALQLVYRDINSPFEVLLEGTGVLIQAAIRTFETDPPIQFNLRSSEIMCKLIIKSANLADALGELDWSNPDCRLCVSPEFPYFRLTSDSAGGSCQIDYPKDSDAFETFECTKTIEVVYKLKHIHPCVKAVSSALKSQIRINAQGLLQLQNMISLSDGQCCFVDFFIMPESLETSD